MLSSAELMEKTGATHRQIDYWCSHGIIKPIGNPNPGSGRPREFSSNIVGLVRVLVVMSHISMKGGLSAETMRKIVENYQSGYWEIDKDIFVSWPVDG